MTCPNAQRRVWDWSVGDVIAAYADGDIVLDDGITTFNPKRAAMYLVTQARARCRQHTERNLEFTDHIDDYLATLEALLREGFNE